MFGLLYCILIPEAQEQQSKMTNVVTLLQTFWMVWIEIYPNKAK
jgi:hypothetical protein